MFVAMACVLRMTTVPLDYSSIVRILPTYTSVKGPVIYLGQQSSDEIMENNDNRRHSYRMPVLDGGRADGRLRIGRKTITCHVLDESYGGYLVSIPKPVRLSAHELSILHMAGGSHPVRIAWQRREGENLHLGLERLPEDFLQRRDSGTLLRVAVILVGFGLGFVYAEVKKTNASGVYAVRATIAESTAPIAVEATPQSE